MEEEKKKSLMDFKMTHEIIPLIPVPKLTDARMQELYDELMKQPIPGNIRNPENYIFMPQHNLYVAKERSHFNEDWYQAHKALHSEGARMLTLREFTDFLILLRNGNDEFRKIYNDITEVRKDWRAEWLDADFEAVNDKLHINYNRRAINGKLKPQNSAPLESCLMGDCKVDLTSFNRQGLPTREGNEFNYRFLRSDNNSVAGFGAYSLGAGLYCNWNPLVSYSELGVRAARIGV